MSGQALQGSPVLHHWLTDTYKLTVKGSKMIKFCNKCGCETDRLKNGDCRPCNARRCKERYAIMSNSPEEKEKRRQYRLKNAESACLKSKLWRINNPEKKASANKKWAQENQDKVKLSNLKYLNANRELLNAKNLAWAKANPENARRAAHARRARKMATGGELSNGISANLFKLQRGKCPCCKQPLGDDYHLDHIMPLYLGGSNTDDNIQLLRATCNRQKHTKHPIDFMQQRGFLL